LPHPGARGGNDSLKKKEAVPTLSQKEKRKKNGPPVCWSEGRRKGYSSVLWWKK